MIFHITIKLKRSHFAEGTNFLPLLHKKTHCLVDVFVLLYNFLQLLQLCLVYGLF